jgi:hypothetical protein
MAPAPSPTERAPNRHRHSFACPHCGAYAAHAWHALGFQVDNEDGYPSFTLAELRPLMAQSDDDVWNRGAFDTSDSARGKRQPAANSWVEDSTWAQSVCNGCREVTTWRLEVIVYPQSSPAPFPHEDMPESVIPLYNEARSVVNLSRRAAAALARATMEKLLRELDPEAPKGARLDERTLRVESKVSSGLAQLLTFIRHVGNQSLHVSGAPDNAVILVLDTEASEPVEAIFEAINELVDELKTKPARNQRLAALVPDGVFASLDRKRQALVSGAAGLRNDDGTAVDPSR